jgi:hypothetical protein
VVRVAKVVVIIFLVLEFVLVFFFVPLLDQICMGRCVLMLRFLYVQRWLSDVLEQLNIHMKRRADPSISSQLSDLLPTNVHESVALFRNLPRS